MRVRARYAKRGRLRFVSAIDLGRIWERALRKAELPIAYSEGFTPHPKVSFPDALPLGYASTGEYVELTFAVDVDVDVAVRRFNRAAPDGLAITAARPVADGAPRLSRWLGASLWSLRYALQDAVVLERSARTLADAEQLPVDRERKGRTTRLDLRPALHCIAVDGDTVHTVLHHTEPPFRPSEVHQAMECAADDQRLAPPVLVSRIAQGTAEPGGVREAISQQFVSAAHDEVGAATE